MKYRPLCTSYLTEAIGRLEEVAVAEERPQLVIEPVVVIGSAVDESSSESETEQVLQDVPPQRSRTKAQTRTHLPLDDDISFEFIKPDPMENNDKDDDTRTSSHEKREAGEATFEGMPPNSPKESIQDSVSSVKDDEIFSMDSSSVEREAVQPFQLVPQVTKITKKKKRPATPISASFDRDPFEESDDELDNLQSTGKRRLAKKKYPRVVDVSSNLSQVESLLDSQSQVSENDDYTKDDIENEFATMDVDDYNELVLDMPPLEDTALNTSREPLATALREEQDAITEDAFEIPVAPQEYTEARKIIVTEYLPIEPATFIKIMQSLGYSQSRKRIAADPCVPIHRAVAMSHSFLYNEDGKARLFCLPKEQHQDTDIVMSEPIEERDHTSLLRDQHSKEERTKVTSRAKGAHLDTNVVVGSLKDQTSSMDVESLAAQVTTTRDRVNESDVSRDAVMPSASVNALVPVHSSVSVPPVWVDVCKAIMDLQQKNPEALALLAGSTNSRNPVSNVATSSRASKQENVAGETPILKRDTKEDSRPRVVSDAKPTKRSAVEDAICEPKKQSHRTEQEKLDRRERKRQKKEKRERKKQKKAQRKERKRKAREQNSLVESHRSSHVDSAPKQSPLANQPSRKDQQQDAANVSAERVVKKRKIEDPRLKVGKPTSQRQRALSAGSDVPPAENPLYITQPATIQGAQGRGSSQNPVVGARNVSGKRTAAYLGLRSDSNHADNLVADDVVFNDNQGKARESKLGQKEKKRRRSNEAPKPSENGMLPTQRKRQATKNNSSEASGRPKENVANANRDGWSGRPSMQNTAQKPLVRASSNAAAKRTSDQSKLRALCSESFFEEWTDVIALLASGQWHSMCVQSHSTGEDAAPSVGPKIQLFDTPLLEGGVDIELPGHAIIIYRCSSWETPETAKACARHLVRLTALEMYQDIDVLICADTEISSGLADSMAFIQNSVISQNGINSKSPTFQVVAPSLVAPLIASSVMSTRTQGIPRDSFINASVGDARIQERARFLRSISPSLSVCGALQCLLCLFPRERNQDDPSSRAFQQLMKSCFADRRLFGNDKLFEVNASALRQLSMAINASFA